MMKMKNFNHLQQLKKAGLIIPLLVFYIFAMPVKAQFISCGTILQQEQIDLEVSFNTSSVSFVEEFKSLSVNIQVVNDKSGAAGITETAIYNAIESLNENFTGSFIRFTVCDIQYIENYQYNSISTSNESELINKYLAPKMINVFVVEQLADYAGNPVCAYTYYPSANKNYIIIAKDCFNSIDITHQMGHLFGLYHTHETVFDKETPKGTNCSTSGDLICDTPADPMLAGKVDNDCIYTASTKLEGEYYIPEVTNFMSFSRPSCMCEFSEEQNKRMQAAFYTYKSDLW